MAQDIAENKFIEHAQVHNNVYGTSLEAVSHVQSQGKICILDIDIQGVSRVKMAEFYPAPYFVFISPPSITHLEDRLRARNTETEETIRVRLENAAEEMQYGTQLHFDKVLVNDGLERAFADLLRTLTEWYPYLLTN
jgi:guanylate kinase